MRLERTTEDPARFDVARRDKRGHAALRTRELSAKAILLETLAVLAGSTALTILVTWPLVADINGRLLGTFASDAPGGIAWLWQRHLEGGYHLFGTTHHTLTGAPLGWDQGNGLNLQWFLPYFPAYLLSGPLGPIATFNLVTFTGFVLSGSAMYLLVRWLGCGRLVAAWSGLVFIVFPWHLAQAIAGHASLVHLEVFPLFVLAFLAWARQPSRPRLVLVAVATAVVWMTAALFGIMLAIALPGLVLATAWRHQRLLGARQALLQAFAISAALLIPTALMAALGSLGSASGGLGTARPSSSLLLFGAQLHGFWEPSRSRALAGTELQVYLGWLTIVLALGWLALAIRRWRRLPDTLRLATILLTVTALVGFVFSLAHPLLLPIVHRYAHPMPSLLLWKLAPQFRVPARFVAILMTALIPLAALGLQGLSRAVGRWARSAAGAERLAAVACIGAAVVSFAELSVNSTTTKVGPRPPEYSALSSIPKGILAEYPLLPSNRGATGDYIFWQRIHGWPLLNGAADSTPADDMRRVLADPSGVSTASSLASLGVAAIITRPTTYDFVDARGRKPSTGGYGPGYQLVQRFPNGASVWRVVAKPAPAVATFRSPGFEGPNEFVLGALAQYMTVASGRIDVYDSRPGVWRLRLPLASRDRARRVVISGRLGSRAFVVHGEKLLSVPVQLPPGHSTLAISVDPAPTTSDQRSSVLAGSIRFAPSPAGDRDRALRPALLSPTLPW
ncbi:MAG: hypothetical protein ACXVZP_03300 [Gaiellaceae bacterium]